MHMNTMESRHEMKDKSSDEPENAKGANKEEKDNRVKVEELMNALRDGRLQRIYIRKRVRTDFLEFQRSRPRIRTLISEILET